MASYVNFHCPTSWNEMSGYSLLRVAYALLNSYSITSAQLKSFTALIELRWWQVRRQWHLFFADNESCERMCQAADFIWNSNTLTSQLLPRIRIRFTYLYGPADMLKNLTFKEFVYAYNVYRAYKSTGKTHRLNELIAILYRPKVDGLTSASKEYNGDLREPFNNNLVDQRARLVANLPRHYKFAIQLFFEGCFSQIVERYDKLFAKNDTDSEAAGNLKELIHRLAGNEFGNFQETEQQNIYDILDQLKINVEDQDKHNRELAHQQNKSKT